MFKPTFVRTIVILLLAATTCFAQSPADGLIDAAKIWLKNINSGARSELLASTDERFIATTPAGDVLVRERLIPSDKSQPIQQLPLMELVGPVSRIIGESGVVMSRLKPSTGPALNATFVFVREKAVWKLVAVHFSPTER